MLNTPTVKQYVHHNVANYHILFASSSYDVSKFSVFDQLLNVIGNGIRSNENLIEHLNIEIVDATRFFKEPVTTGYYKLIDYGSGYFHADISGESVTCFISEKNQYPEVKRWVDYELKEEFKMPYPNFTKEYSLVWRCPEFLNLDSEWKESAIWFYKKAREIISNREKEYSYAFPLETELKNKNTIDNQIAMFGNRTNEEVSRDWQHPYDGDIVKFLTTRWQKEKQRIFDFIDETIEMLENHIHPK